MCCAASKEVKGDFVNKSEQNYVTFVVNPTLNLDKTASKMSLMENKSQQPLPFCVITQI